MADRPARQRERSTPGLEDRTVPTELPARGGATEERARQTTVRRLGQPFDRQNPFVAGFVATMGVLLALALGAAIYSIRGTLVLVFLALFIAVGLEPAVEFFTRSGIRRSLAVLVVVFVATAVVAAFVYSAISPIEREINELIKQVPTWRKEIASGKGTIGHITKDLHLSDYLSGTRAGSVASDLASGALGAGKIVLSAVSAFLIVVVLTIYFLAALPAIKTFSSHLVPQSRRHRFEVILDEVLAGVGGYLLGNLFTSLIAGLGTFLWATVLGIPYPILLGLVVAFLDLIPVVGSTIAGVIVSLVALSVSLPIALSTAAFYIAYRFVEDYLLVPRVMRHAVNVSPVLTVLAVVIGGALLGIIGALVAIPIAAGIKLILEQTVFPRFDNS